MNRRIECTFNMRPISRPYPEGGGPAWLSCRTKRRLSSSGSEGSSAPRSPTTWSNGAGTRSSASTNRACRPTSARPRTPPTSATRPATTSCPVGRRCTPSISTRSLVITPASAASRSPASATTRGWRRSSARSPRPRPSAHAPASWSRPRSRRSFPLHRGGSWSRAVCGIPTPGLSFRARRPWPAN